MVPITALVPYAFMQPSRKAPILAALGLGESLAVGGKFTRVVNYLAGAKSQKIPEAWINAHIAGR